MTDPRSLAERVTDFRDTLAVVDPVNSQAAAIDDIQALEQLKSACAAAQARRTAELEALRHAEEAERGVAKARRGKGLGAEVGLARGQSLSRGAGYLDMANALAHEMPNTRTALTFGQIGEEHAQIVVKETGWLSTEHRTEVDALMADRLTAGGLGPRKLAAEVRAHAQRLDQPGAVARNEKATIERRVTVRPAAHGMAYLTALLPTPQAIGIYASLKRDASTTASSDNATGQSRTQDQIMADQLVQRATGQTTAQAVPVEVQLVMTDAALFGNGDTPARLTGYGPIPAEIARQWLADPEAKVFLRRLFTRPEDHQLVGMEKRRRTFPPSLRRMVAVRDDTCRSPNCDALTRDIDHVTPARDGGPTSWANASGLCVGCNQTKETAGWKHQATPEQLTVTTPTGHQYSAETGPVLTGMPPADEGPPSTCNYAVKKPEPTIVMRVAA